MARFLLRRLLAAGIVLAAMSFSITSSVRRARHPFDHASAGRTRSQGKRVKEVPAAAKGREAL